MLLNLASDLPGICWWGIEHGEVTSMSFLGQAQAQAILHASDGLVSRTTYVLGLL